MTGNDELLLDQYFYLANQRDELLMSFSPQLTNGASGFYHIAKQMKATVNYYRGELVDMGKGGKSDGSQTIALSEFARGFSVIFEGMRHKVSAAEDSLFSELVTFWFNELLGIEIKYPKHHIFKVLH
jgi:hypothetical protein